jgi:ABC-type protease/lipase transport system fused ATPase/permease subunit
VLWVMRHAQSAAEFDKLMVMKDGRIADQGKPVEVLARITGVPAEQAAQ